MKDNLVTMSEWHMAMSETSECVIGSVWMYGWK